MQAAEKCGGGTDANVSRRVLEILAGHRSEPISRRWRKGRKVHRRDNRRPLDGLTSEGLTSEGHTSEGKHKKAGQRQKASEATNMRRQAAGERG